VLVGGTPSVAAFAGEVAEAEGGEALPPHTATKGAGGNPFSRRSTETRR